MLDLGSLNVLDLGSLKVLDRGSQVVASLGNLEVLDQDSLEEAFQGGQVVASLGNLEEAYLEGPVLDSLEEPCLEGHHILIKGDSLEGDRRTSLVMSLF